MVPAHITVFLSQKPSTQGGILLPSIMHSLLSVVWVGWRPRARSSGAHAEVELLVGERPVSEHAHAGVWVRDELPPAVEWHTHGP